MNVLKMNQVVNLSRVSHKDTCIILVIWHLQEKRDIFSGRLIICFVSNISVSLIECEWKNLSLIISVGNYICSMEMSHEVSPFMYKSKISP